MPVGAEFPDPEECPRLQGAFLGPPKPSLALDNVMGAIDGDGTPWSYTCASVLARELAAFGSMWHGCVWSTHRIHDADPWGGNHQDRKGDMMGPIAPAADWDWVQPGPIDWRQQDVQDGDRHTVTVLTCSGLPQEGISRHTDVFAAGHYKFESQRHEIARAPGGFVF